MDRNVGGCSDTDMDVDASDIYPDATKMRTRYTYAYIRVYKCDPRRRQRHLALAVEVDHPPDLRIGAWGLPDFSYK